MKTLEYIGKVGDDFRVHGETSGEFLFVIPEEERGTCDLDRVSVGDRIRIDWRSGFVAFERIRP